MIFVEAQGYLGKTSIDTEVNYHAEEEFVCVGREGMYQFLSVKEGANNSIHYISPYDTEVMDEDKLTIEETYEIAFAHVDYFKAENLKMEIKQNS